MCETRGQSGRQRRADEYLGEGGEECPTRGIGYFASVVTRPQAGCCSRGISNNMSHPKQKQPKRA